MTTNGDQAGNGAVCSFEGIFERQGYEIKGEVRTCDLVGIREDEAQPLIVEMKKSFNLALLLQGIERLRLSPNVYLAVERVREKKGAVNQRWGELSGLCRRLGLGLITVVFYKTKAPLVEVLVEPGEAPPQAAAPCAAASVCSTSSASAAGTTTPAAARA